MSPGGSNTVPPEDHGSTVRPAAACLPWASLLCTLLPSVHHQQAGACSGPSSQLLVDLQSQSRPRKNSSAPQTVRSALHSLFCSPPTCLQATCLDETLDSLETWKASVLASPTKSLEWQGFKALKWNHAILVFLSMLYLTEHNMFSRSIHVGAYFKIEFLYRPPVNKSVLILFC